jgi:hypothetical protein
VCAAVEESVRIWFTQWQAKVRPILIRCKKGRRWVYTQKSVNLGAGINVNVILGMGSGPGQYALGYMVPICLPAKLLSAPSPTSLHQCSFPTLSLLPPSLPLSHPNHLSDHV